MEPAVGRSSAGSGLGFGKEFEEMFRFGHSLSQTCCMVIYTSEQLIGTGVKACNKSEAIAGEDETPPRETPRLPTQHNDLGEAP